MSLFKMLIKVIAILIFFVGSLIGESSKNIGGFRSVKFPHSAESWRYGWLAGSRGVYYTRDYGATWVRQPATICSKEKVKKGNCSFPSKNGSIVWADNYNIVVAAEDGLLVGGIESHKWKTIKDSNNLYQNLKIIAFFSKERGWGIDFKDQLYFTPDSGKSWNLIYDFKDKNTRSMFVQTNDSAWLICNDGTLLDTETGGHSWNSRKVGEVNRSEQMRYIQFAGSPFGWCAGSLESLFRSMDGGDSWERISQLNKVCHYIVAIGFEDWDTGWVIGTNAVPAAEVSEEIISFAQDTNEIISISDCGTSEKCEGISVFNTRDSGKTWNTQIDNYDDVLCGIQALTRGQAWIVGNVGTVLKTSDYGKKWTRVNIY
jgi:photosystem II stability/assembly factor-like uncharacterized protein